MERISIDVMMKFKDGDKTAFKTIYVRYSPSIYSVSTQLLKDGDLAEEMVQECFMKLWLSRSGIQVERDLWPYLYVMCKRLCFNVLRDKEIVKKSIEYFQEDLVNDVEHRVYHNELQHHLQLCIAQLPLQQRTAWILSREEGFTHQEIAARMDISQNTVKNHIGQALKFLRDRLSSQGFISLSLVYIFF